ncbi:MAG: LemA family protein [Ruminiclostridium sp.]|nr:LemA family protein [Ruminiclostridium sp.]
MSDDFNEYPFARWLKWGIAVLVILILLVTSISSYNGLVAADQAVQQQWAQVENKMQRRADVIVNLAAVVQEAEKHEEKVFGAIAAARSSAEAAKAILNDNTEGIQSKLDANKSLNEVLRSISVVVEAYPELKSNEQFTMLGEEIAGSENRISIERGRFIDAVQVYNLKIKRFPGNIFAGLTGFTPKDYYKADENAQKAPDLNKLFKE